MYITFKDCTDSMTSQFSRGVTKWGDIVISELGQCGDCLVTPILSLLPLIDPWTEFHDHGNELDQCFLRHWPQVNLNAKEFTKPLAQT